MSLRNNVLIPITNMYGIIEWMEWITTINSFFSCCQTFYICNPFREFSSAGSEHLPYKQRVGGSNPSTPTKKV